MQPAGQRGFFYGAEMTEQLRRITANLERPEGVRHAVHEGRDHLVVPVVMIVEGVLNGSLLTQAEFGKYVESWNGRPVPVLHPERDGEPVSANQPDIIERNTLGYIFNANAENGRLRAEAWLDIEKAQRLGHNQLLQDLEAGKAVEVSTGYFSDYKPQAGEFNGKAYERIDINIRPDHLALLPGQIGACSVADGCGTRVNSEKGYLMKTKQALEAIAQALGFRANCECEDDMTVEQRMKARVEKLRANKKLSPEQIEMLMKMDAEQLALVDAMASAIGETAAMPEPAEPEGNEGEDDLPMDPEAMAEEDKPENFQANAADIDKLVANRVAEHLDRAEAMRELTANEACPFDESELRAMSVKHLQKLAKHIRPKDYSGQGGFASNAESGPDADAQPLTIHTGVLTGRKQKEA